MLLRASLQSRLNRLGPAREVLEAAAVIGRDVPVALLERVVRPGKDLGAALDKLVDFGIVLQRGASDPAYTFKHAADEELRKEPASKVVFTLEQHGAVVKLTLTHEGFIEGSKLLDGISKGWPAILASLKSLLESGKPLPIPLAALGIEGIE